MTDQITCYICGETSERSRYAPEEVQLVRYLSTGRWKRVNACWSCRETWADRIELLDEEPAR